MSEKMHNDDYDIKLIDGDATNSNDSTKGNFNKIKLKFTSYAITMEVQKAYMQEEMKEKEASLKNTKNDQEQATGKDKRKLRNKIMILKAELEDLKNVYEEYIKSHKRFVDMAKKALNLPDENFEEMKVSAKELGDEGLDWINVSEKEKQAELNVENINNDVTNPYSEAQTTLNVAQDEDIFSSIDSDAIKEEIDRFMNSKVNSDGEQKPLADIITNKVTADNFENLVEEVSKNINQLGSDDVKDLLNSSGTLNNPEKEYSHEQPEDKFVSADVFDTPAGEWTEGLNDIPFDDDKSMERFIKGLEDENTRLKAHGEELSSKLSDVRSEQTDATRKHEQALKERDDAKRRAEEAQRQIELLNSYKPKMDELRKANEEQEKLNSDKEEELRKENETLATINSETTTIKTETAAYDEETSKALEELKKLRAEFAGTGYDSGDTQMTSGGRTM